MYWHIASNLRLCNTAVIYISSHDTGVIIFHLNYKSFNFINKGKALLCSINRKNNIENARKKTLKLAILIGNLKSFADFTGSVFCRNKACIFDIKI